MAKKAVSPVVAVVILIGIAVMTGGLLSSWISSFVTESARQDTCAITTMYSISDVTYNASSGEVKMKLKNTGKSRIYNFTVEADNGTIIKILDATSPPDTYEMSTGETQYLIANGSAHNITNIQKVTAISQSCPSYSPTAVEVKNL